MSATPPAPVTPPAPAASAQGSRLLAILAIVFAAVALVTAFIPVLTLITWLPGLAALVLGIVALAKRRGVGLGVAAVVVGPVAIVLAIVMGFVYASATLQTAFDAASDAANASTGGSTPAPAESATPAASDYAVTITGATMSKDYSGAPVMIVSYEFTNNTGTPASFALSLNAQAYQAGIELSDLVVGVDGLDQTSWSSDIKPGVTVAVQQGYLLRDTSTVSVEVSKLISFDQSVLASRDFTVQ